MLIIYFFQCCKQIRPTLTSEKADCASLLKNSLNKYYRLRDFKWDSKAISDVDLKKLKFILEKSDIQGAQYMFAEADLLKNVPGYHKKAIR